MSNQKNCWKEKRFWLVALLFFLLLIGTNLGAYSIGVFKGTLSGGAGGNCDLAAPESLEEEWNIFIEVLEQLQQNYLYPLDSSRLVRGAVHGAIEAVEDPRTGFYDARDLENFMIQTKGTFGGIGVRIIEAGGEIVVFETIPNSPATGAGIMPGDRIMRAGNRELSGLGLEHAADNLRGEKGSSVTLSIKRPGREEELNLTLVRDEVKIDTVSSHWEQPGLGYIRISNFDSNTGSSFTEQLRLLENDGLKKGLILDLRDNPGGQVEEAIKVARLIVPEGEITRLVGRDEEVQNIYHSAIPAKDYPIAVLINEDTASAAEILAGALQDREAALLIGVNSYGKATVQQFINLTGGNALLVTVAHYLTPAGKDINGSGLEPHIVVDMTPLMRYYRYFFPGPLARGAYGSDVQLLQEMLAELGYEPSLDGYYDEATALALSIFQSEAGLEASGKFDDLTWVQLREAFEDIACERDPQLIRAVELMEQPGIWPEPEVKGS